MPGPRGGLRAACWSLIAVVPFLVFPVAHDWRAGPDATGMTMYELPYYAANARAVIDRGAYGFYPNAFDPSDAAPAIYFHWLIAGIGILTGPLGIDPGTVFLVIGLVAGWIAARLMFALVEMLWRGRFAVPLYLSTMWGGGLLVLGQLAANLAEQRPWNESLLGFDPGQGLWFLNFGRNLILPTEAVYHALMVGLWLAMLRDRWKPAGGILWLIATTHPFTGAQALAIVGAWVGLRVAILRQPVPLGFLVNLAAVGAAFGAYYFVFLPRFPAHRELQEVWTLGWTMSGATIVLAYGVPLLLALGAISRDADWRRRTAFLMTAAAVSFLLANHHWFITPRQPIHFTRGYIWTPLWLIGLPTLARLLDRLVLQPPLRAIALGGVLSAVIVSDNFAFLTISAGRGAEAGFTLSADERRAFGAISALGTRGVLLTEDEQLSYLAAVYTPARPYYGHKYNTPQFEQRRERVRALVDGGTDEELLKTCHVVLTRSATLGPRLETAGWKPVGLYGDLRLWTKL